MSFLTNTQGYALSQNVHLLLSTRKTPAISSCKKFCDKFGCFQRVGKAVHHINVASKVCQEGWTFLLQQLQHKASLELPDKPLSHWKNDNLQKLKLSQRNVKTSEEAVS